MTTYVPFCTYPGFDSRYLRGPPRPPSVVLPLDHCTSVLPQLRLFFVPNMSAAVMSNYYFPPLGQGHVADSQVRVQNWMLAQMANYPPPPQHDHQHYNALYPASAGAQQLLDPHEHLQYSDLNQPIYPKVESATSEHASSNHQMHHLAHELQQHAALEEQQRQQIQQASQHMQQQNPHGQQPGSSQPSQPTTGQGTPDQNQKTNRLRKACDSCSIRKVKVGISLVASAI